MKLTSEEIMQIIDDEIGLYLSSYDDLIKRAKRDLGHGWMPDKDYLMPVYNFGLSVDTLEGLKKTILKRDSEGANE